VFHFTKTGDVPIDRLAVGVPYQDKSNVSRWGHTEGRDRRCRGSCWFVPYETIQNRADERPHPATFPTKLAANCIKLHGLRPDLTVLDPFLGLGSAGLAAQECGASKFVGFEIDPSYLEIARQRLGLPPAEPSPIPVTIKSL
jgi:site-specific DNA-methyltransferase (adenine-specific)